MDNQVEALVAAWTVEGPVAWYHKLMQDKLRDEWPVLAEAIENLVECVTDA